MESYVERWQREQQKAKKEQKAAERRKTQKQKGVIKDGENTRGEGQAAKTE